MVISPPLELIDGAVLMWIDVLAITDHDTVNGILPALQYINEKSKPLTLIAGIEISTIWEKLKFISSVLTLTWMQTVLNIYWKCKLHGVTYVGGK